MEGRGGRGKTWVARALRRSLICQWVRMGVEVGACAWAEWAWAGGRLSEVGGAGEGQ